MPRALASASLLLVGLTLFAFWPTYLGKSFAGIDRYTHLHAALGALWLALVLAQASLMARRHYAIHRSVGRVAWLIAPLFVLSAVLLANFRFSHMDEPTFTEQAYTLYLPLSGAFLFGLAFVLAMANRRSTPLHARFMACTALILVDPVVGRVLGFYVVELPQFWHYQIITFGIETIVLVALVITLEPHTAQRRVFARFAGVYFAVLLLWFFVPNTAAWYAFADWFRRLPLSG